MNKRETKELVSKAVAAFFEDMGIAQLFADFFGQEPAQQVLHNGFTTYQTVMSDNRESAPEEVKEIAAQAVDCCTISEEAFAEKVYDIYKKRFCEVMLPAAVYISVKEQLTELLQKPADENMLLLLKGTIEEVIDSMQLRFANLGNLMIQGIPSEAAEEIVDAVGDKSLMDAVVAALVCSELNDSEEDETDDDKEDWDDDGEEDEDELDEGEEEHHCACGGECGGHCSCKNGDACKNEGTCQNKE